VTLAEIGRGITPFTLCIFAAREIMKDFQSYLESIDLDMMNSLAEPIEYTLGTGGKRIRPALTIAAHQCYVADTAAVWNAAASIEFFHNFSLIHDDIMDDAPLRRGKPSAFGKYGMDRAILSGDAMLVHCYRLLEAYADHPRYAQLLKTFSSMAVSICEGQQSDMDFEQRTDVGLDEYLIMIRQKTADLLSAALSMGAMVAGAPEKDLGIWSDLGRTLGLSFQMQDDWLDYYSDHPSQGKQKAGDVIQRKKSLLYIICRQKLVPSDADDFTQLYHDTTMSQLERLDRVQAHFQETDIKASVAEMIRIQQREVSTILEQLADRVPREEGMTHIRAICAQLADRQF